MNDSSKHKKPLGWAEQLEALRPLIEATDAAPRTDVEFLQPPQENGPLKKMELVVSGAQNEIQKDLNDVSRGHIAFSPKNTAPPREIDTGFAKQVLAEDMEEAKINILPENTDVPTNQPISPDDMEAFQNVMDHGFLDEPKNAAPTENPAVSLIKDIETKLRQKAKDLHAKEKDGDAERLKKLELAVIDLSKRALEITGAAEKSPTEEAVKNLKEILEEVETVGSKTWIARFTEQKPVMSTIPRGGGDGSAHVSLDNKAGWELAEGEWVPEQKAGDMVPHSVDVSVSLVKPPATKQETAAHPEEQKFLSIEIANLYQKDFRLAQEDLNRVTTKIKTPEGEKTIRFSDLSEGQQRLLLHNLKDFALDNAKTQALKKFTEEEKEKYEKAGFIKKAFLSYTKSYRRAANIAQIEKELLASPEMNRDAYREVLEDMLGIAYDAPEVVQKNENLQINFALEKDFPEASKSLLEVFNDAAGNFAKIPPEWAYSIDEKEREKYREAHLVYTTARKELFALKTSEGGGREAFERLADLDKKIQFTQLFQTNPDVEKAFAETKDQKAWIAGLKAIAKEKGSLWALGRTLSTLGAGIAVSIGSGFTAPIGVALAGGLLGGSASGSILGWLTARKRAELEVSDTKKLAEMGVEGSVSNIHTFTQKTYDYDKEKGTKGAFTEKIGEEKERSVVQEAGDIEKKLEYALNRALGAEGDTIKKEKLLQILADRIQYTEEKLRLETVSFGEGADGFSSRYELLSTLAKSRTLYEMSGAEKNMEVEQKINSLLERQGERVEAAENKHKSEKIRQGVKYGFFLGGAFGAILSSVSYAAKEGDISAMTNTETTAAPKKIPLAEEMLRNPFATEKNIPNQGESNVILGQNEDPLKEVLTPEAKTQPPSSDMVTPAAAQPAPMENILRGLEGVYEVKSGDTIWNILKTKLTEGGQGEFTKLTPRQQNFIIDSLKDKIIGMSQKELHEIGIKSDPNRIYPGDKIELGKIFTDSKELLRLFKRSETFTDVSDVASAPKSTLTPPPANAAEITSPVKNTGIVVEQPTISETPPPLAQPQVSQVPMRPNHDEYIANSIKQTYQNINDTLAATQRNIDQSGAETWMNTHGHETMDPYLTPHGYIPPQYHQWVQRGLYENYPNMTPEMRAWIHQQRMVDIMAKTSYNQTVDTVNHISQLFGIQTPVQLSHVHANDTMEDLLARMAWRTVQSSGNLPPNFPNPNALLDTFNRLTTPRDATDVNLALSDVSTRVSQAIGDAATRASIANSGVTHT